MSAKKENLNRGGQFRFIILIFILIASLMVSSAVIELQQSKKELYQLMTKQAAALLQSLIIASQNSLRATTYLDAISEERLLNNAGHVKRLYENKRVSNTILQEISKQNNIYRINIFNRSGQKIFFSHQTQHFDLPERYNPRDVLQPIFSGERDTLIIGYKRARYKDGFRFAVALAAKDRSAIVLNVEAAEMLKFKRDIAFGALIRMVVSESPDIVYIALQDSNNILAASGNVKELDRINQSAFLKKVFQDSTFATRNMPFESGEIFEAVQTFSNAGQSIGLFRLGLSLEPIEDINERIYRRLIIITVILIIIGFVLFVYIFTRQRLNILQKQYEVVETYSGNIIDNVSDAIIVYDELNGIKIFNDAAENLFAKKKAALVGKAPDILFSENDARILDQQKSLLKQFDYQVGKRRKSLLISKSEFSDDQEIRNTILVIRDLTDQKQMEAQLERQQRLTAMGELASGVAHEIRNPLNTIGTIIQQLDKDFEPVSEKEEYHELAGLVYKEVKRINDTIQDFLRFSRPEPLLPTSFLLAKLFKELEKQYASLLESAKTELSIKLNWQGAVLWDEKQIKQVLVNIIQNSMEAIGTSGIITIQVDSVNESDIEIQIQDDGPGMPEEVRANIFNLYFTTKADGTGIGLSIVQRIIYEHGGVISVESEQNKGTTFIIRLPVRIKTHN